jgi:hypothetical protein
MAKRTTSRGPADDETPKDFAETTPPRMSHGYDFTLQAVHDMRGSVGELCAKVDRLIADVKSQSEKIDAVRMRLAWVTGAAAVVGALVGVALALARFVPATWWQGTG